MSGVTNADQFSGLGGRLKWDIAKTCKICDKPIENRNDALEVQYHGHLYVVHTDCFTAFQVAQKLLN